MDHQPWTDKLWGYYDRELSAEDTARMVAHVPTCADCRRRLDSWVSVSHAVFTPQPAASDDTFVNAVMRRIRNTEDSRAVLPWFARWALPTLALAAASFAASLLFVLQPSDPSTEGLLLAGHSSSLTAQWFEGRPSEAQILNAVVTNP